MEMETETEMEMMMEKEESGMLRWEKVLPRTPVRVLLVEGDDSTRQIIAALLRKCGYKVAVASDGLKAWETLKEQPNSIDLVLTEMELPLMSGFGLLSTITDHEICKKIPVIMMSPHDSVSMVFKCMLKGAADFLVKPIRKNELRNLWQHVWRRQIANGDLGSSSEHQDVNNSKCGPKVGRKEKLSSESLSCVQKTMECSDQRSDAQSSCTRLDLEAESKHAQNILEHKQFESRDGSPMNHVMDQSGGQHIHLESSILMHERGTEATGNEDLIPSSCPDHNDLVDETYCQRYYQGMPHKQIRDFLQVFDDQPKHEDALNDGDAVQNNSWENDVKRISSPFHQLDISSKKIEYIYLKEQENNQRKFLNHSNSSAFSLYTNKPAVAVVSGNTRDKIPGCTGSLPSINFEDTRVNGIGIQIQDGTSIECTPIRVTPHPIPVRPQKNAGVQPQFCPQSTHPFWIQDPSIMQEEMPLQNLSHSSESNKFNYTEVNDAIDQTVRSTCHHSEQRQEETTDVFHEQGNAPSVRGDSGSTTACTGDRIPLSPGMRGGISSINRFTATAENATKDGSYEVPISTIFHSVNPRELALNKFRLKRKERCFEKKVRYQSRKILAEKRPRIKGQFVRQDKLTSKATAGGFYLNNSIT